MSATSNNVHTHPVSIKTLICWKSEHPKGSWSLAVWPNDHYRVTALCWVGPHKGALRTACKGISLAKQSKLWEALRRHSFRVTQDSDIGLVPSVWY